MRYTISEAADRLGITAPTLRYYDKEGLLPFVDRSASGIRLFKEADFEWLGLIECLKATGMPIRDIKQFIDWYVEGDSTLRQRSEMFHERKRAVEEQIDALHRTLDMIDYKCWYYDTALAAGTADVHNCMKPEDIPEDIRGLKARLEMK
jgi:DNA-binding transcriptional MerR regulator